jgi:hypothetical protein
VFKLNYTVLAQTLYFLFFRVKTFSPKITTAKIRSAQQRAVAMACLDDRDGPYLNCSRQSFDTLVGEKNTLLD